MNFNSKLENTSNDSLELPTGLTTEDIIALSNYPSVGKLFDSNDFSKLASMQNKLNNTFHALERVVLRGSSEAAKRAKASIEAIKIATQFLEMLRQIKEKHKSA